MQPKVVFVIPPETHYIESNVSRKIEKGREFRQKLGILAVAGYLRGITGIVPKVIDCLAEGLDGDELTALVSKEQPDVIGFSVLTFNILDCLDILPRFRAAVPDAKIVFGGFHATIYPKETLALPGVDMIVFGEGEVTFAELVTALAAGGDEEHFALILGLGWKDKSGRNIINAERPAAPRHEYDSFPMPAHDLLDIEKYSTVLADSARVASIQTSRGCPGHCVFCDIRMTAYRYRSAESILAEIMYLRELGVKEFFVVDDTFTANPKRLKELCRQLIAGNLGIKFKISSRVDSVTQDMLADLARAGCYRIHYGVETGSQRLLDYLEKGVTLDQIREAFRMTWDVGIEPLAYMMLGIPSETEDEIYTSMRFVEELAPYHSSWSVCTPFPKTKLYEMQLIANPKMDDYWADFARNPRADFKIRTMNEFLSAERLRDLQSEALRRFYSSPKRIFRELVRTRSLRQLARKAQVGMQILMAR